MKQGNKTKKIILDTANELFYKNGYTATSFSNIVNETGLSKGNITYHFKNKQSILEGIIQNRLDNINKSLSLWEEQSKDVEERLIFFCDMIEHERENIKDYGCPMGTLTSEFSKNQPVLYEITIPLFNRFKDWLSEQFTLLGFNKEKASEKALSLLSRVQGIAMVSHSFKDVSFLQKELQEVKKGIKSNLL